MNLEKQRRIEERAYALWEAEGQLHGRHEEHWHRAAREIEAEETASPSVKRSPPRAAGRGTANFSSHSRQRKKKQTAEATVRGSRRGSDVPISWSIDPQRL
jgi:Protein of unknown function (DUF2934)